jgi:hypothetical protein
MALFLESVGTLPPVIARHQVGKLTGGAISPKTLANLDSKGEGPATRLKLGRIVAYPTPVLLEWLESRSIVLSSKPSWDL